MSDESVYLTSEQELRLSKIVNDRQRGTLLRALQAGEEIPDYAWTPIPALTQQQQARVDELLAPMVQDLMQMTRSGVDVDEVIGSIDNEEEAEHPTTDSVPPLLRGGMKYQAPVRSTAEPAEDPGIQTVEYVFEQFQIDNEWCQRSERGFTWWPHEYAQRIWAEEGVSSHGFRVYEVVAETDFLVDRRGGADTAAQLDSLMRFASLSGAVPSGERGLVTLRSTVFVNSETQPWLRWVFSLAAAVQMVNVHILAEEIARMFSMEPAKSIHPKNGFRSVPDEMLMAVESMPQRDEVSAWMSGSEIELTAALLADSGISATNKNGTLFVTFPGGRDGVPFKLYAEPEVPHPQLGGGLQLVLQTDESGSAPTSVSPIEMNAKEISSHMGSHFLGSWCTDPTSGALSFTGFLPNVLCRPRLLFNFALSMRVRAKWASKVLSGRGGRTKG